MVDTKERQTMVSMEQKKQRRARRTFTAEFKQRAVDLALKEGVPIAQAAHDLDVQQTGFRKWVKQAQIDSGKGPEGALTTKRSRSYLAFAERYAYSRRSARY